jgi:NRE family putative nickel resistance protein-like MFS transporter
VTTETERGRSIALSSATSQLLGVLGPGLAGSIAAFVGTREVFFLDGLTFLIAAILIVTLPGKLIVSQNNLAAKTIDKTVADIRAGTTCLFADPPIRYALALQLVTSIAGAEILVNTVSHVQSSLHVGKVEYGWVMAAFGIGATLASIGLGNLPRKISPILLTSVGAVSITLALLPANLANLGGLLLLWAIAGAGQTLVNVPTQTLIADRVDVAVQGRVYGAHFAWSHLWWVFAYPLAGWIGSHAPTHNFLYSSLMGLVLLIVVYVVLQPRQLTNTDTGLWHEHDHLHHEHHHHRHEPSVSQNSHSHLHFHATTLTEINH